MTLSFSSTTVLPFTLYVFPSVFSTLFNISIFSMVSTYKTALSSAAFLLDLSTKLNITGTAISAMTASITMTAKSSINVKPFFTLPLLFLLIITYFQEWCQYSIQNKKPSFR